MSCVKQSHKACSFPVSVLTPDTERRQKRKEKKACMIEKQKLLLFSLLLLIIPMNSSLWSFQGKRTYGFRKEKKKKKNQVLLLRKSLVDPFRAEESPIVPFYCPLASPHLPMTPTAYTCQLFSLALPLPSTPTPNLHLANLSSRSNSRAPFLWNFPRLAHQHRWKSRAPRIGSKLS